MSYRGCKAISKPEAENVLRISGDRQIVDWSRTCKLHSARRNARMALWHVREEGVCELVKSVFAM
jgi:hypothetical protein